jgi:tape measure domain-containing protein
MTDQTVTAKFLADISDFQSKMRALQASAKEAQASAKELSTGLTQSGTGMQTVGKNAESAASGMKKMGEGGKEASMGLNEMVSRVSQSIGDWQQLISMVVQFVQAADKVNQAAKDTQIAFTYLTGSAQKAQEAIKSLNSTFAAQAFGTKAVDDVAQHFLMLGKDANTTQKEIIRVGDALSAMGSDAKNLQPAIEQMHKIQDATIVTKEDMKQLVDDGVPAWNALAEGMSAARGKTISVAEAQKEVNAGAIHGKEAYQDMMTGMMQYAGAAEEKSKSLSSAWQQFGEEAAPLLIPLIENLTKFLHNVNEIIAAIGQLKQAMDGLGGGGLGQTIGGAGYILQMGGLGMFGPLSGMGAYASGGKDLPQGWRVVGEDGPELQYSPGGDTIIPTNTDPMTFLGLGGSARSALSSVGSMSSITIHLTTTTMLDSRVVAQQTIPHIAPIMRRQFSRRV